MLLGSEKIYLGFHDQLFIRYRMEDLDGDGLVDPHPRSASLGDEEFPNCRDRLIGAIYEAAADPDAYGAFVSALSDYLENTAVNSWNIADLSEVDIDVVEADSGLAMHLANLNRKLAEESNRKPAGSLRERIAYASKVALAIDRSGRFASVSSAARTILEQDEDGIEALAQLLHAEDARHLREAITKHCTRGDDVPTRILRGEGLHLIIRTLWSDADRETYLCVEALTIDWSQDLEGLLETSFRLTAAEIRVVERLMAGDAVKTIASRFKRSEGTVRNQIKSILAKTEAGGIANLNRMLALIADNIAGVPSFRGPKRGHSAELEVLTLPDGRVMEVRQQGPRDGRPVLFLHGMLFGSEMSASALALLEDTGLRLIAPARPSFGLSDPSPGYPGEETERLVQDLLFILDRYGVSRTVCLTNIAGAVYGYAFAAAAPERVSGLVHAASIIPVLKARQFVLMPPTQRLISFLMRFVPEYLPPLLRSGIAQIRASGELPFLATLYKEGTRDHAVANRPDLFDLMVRSVHFATDQGYLPAFTDTLHIVRDWSPYVQRVSDFGIPSIHVHGGNDPQYPIEDVARFAHRFDSLELRCVEDAGQLLLFDQPEPIIGAVAELVAKVP